MFAGVFISIGWIAPIAYASYAPADHFIESESFDTANTTLDSETHSACFERTVHREAAGEIFVELWLVPENGERIELQSISEDKFFSEGSEVIKMDISLPDTLLPGEYRYERVHVMELANGQVQRSFSFESDTFTIHPPGKTIEQNDSVC